jgi:hypothetical protein
MVNSRLSCLFWELNHSYFVRDFGIKANSPTEAVSTIHHQDEAYPCERAMSKAQGEMLHARLDSRFGPIEAGFAH